MSNCPACKDGILVPKRSYKSPTPRSYFRKLSRRRGPFGPVTRGISWLAAGTRCVNTPSQSTRPRWRNRQTQWIESPPPKGVQVQPLLGAPLSRSMAQPAVYLPNDWIKVGTIGEDPIPETYVKNTGNHHASVQIGAVTKQYWVKVDNCYYGRTKTPEAGMKRADRILKGHRTNL